jgi:hypothetical protein
VPRPISWLARIHEIRRAVAGSVRSHYERKEIEALFQVQPRTAQLLLETLPTTVIGRSRLVERQALADFLTRIQEADDPSAELDLIRSQGTGVSRKKVRTLVRRDIDPVQLDSLPSNVEIIPGQMIVSFRTIEDLAHSMYMLARVIESAGDELARRFEIHNNPDDDADLRYDFEAMIAELDEMKTQRSADQVTPTAL